MEHRPVREAGESVPGAAQSVRDVLIVDDHPLMCEALSMTLTAAFGLARVRTAASLAAAEASIGLAILLQLYRRFKTLDIDAASEMRG